jgi:hypothetical protein
MDRNKKNVVNHTRYSKNISGKLPKLKKFRGGNTSSTEIVIEPEF